MTRGRWRNGNAAVASPWVTAEISGERAFAPPRRSSGTVPPEHKFSYDGQGPKGRIGVLRIGERAELLSALERLRELDLPERLRRGSDGMRSVPSNRVEGPIRNRSFEDRQILQRDRVALGVLRRLLPNELGRGPRRKRLPLARVLIGQWVYARGGISAASRWTVQGREARLVRPPG